MFTEQYWRSWKKNLLSRKKFTDEPRIGTKIKFLIWAFCDYPFLNYAHHSKGLALDQNSPPKNDVSFKCLKKKEKKLECSNESSITKNLMKLVRKAVVWFRRRRLSGRLDYTLLQPLSLMVIAALECNPG